MYVFIVCNEMIRFCRWDPQSWAPRS